MRHVIMHVISIALLAIIMANTIIVTAGNNNNNDWWVVALGRPPVRLGLPYIDEQLYACTDGTEYRVVIQGAIGPMPAPGKYIIYYNTTKIFKIWRLEESLLFVNKTGFYYNNGSEWKYVKYECNGTFTLPAYSNYYNVNRLEKFNVSVTLTIPPQPPGTPPSITGFCAYAKIYPTGVKIDTEVGPFACDTPALPGTEGPPCCPGFVIYVNGKQAATAGWGATVKLQGVKTGDVVSVVPSPLDSNNGHEDGGNGNIHRHVSKAIEQHKAALGLGAILGLLLLFARRGV